MATIANTHNIFYSDNHLLVPKGKREHVPYGTTTPPMKANLTMIRKDIVRLSFNGTPQKGGCCMAMKKLNSTDKHLESLNSYLVKLDDDAKEHVATNLNPSTLKITKVVRVLDNYLDKDKNDVKSKNVISSAKNDQGSQRERSLKNYMELKLEDAVGKGKSEDEASDFYLIGVLVSINIAVFLFEIATPVKNSGFELFSLPMVYGAKINNLILTGEWWRLVTPIFLVQD